MNKEMRLGLYWAAKEIATKIQREKYPMDNYYGGNFYFKESKFINHITQLLKKEFIASRLEEEKFESWGYFVSQMGVTFDELSSAANELSKM